MIFVDVGEVSGSAAEVRRRRTGRWRMCPHQNVGSTLPLVPLFPYAESVPDGGRHGQGGR